MYSKFFGSFFLIFHVVSWINITLGQEIFFTDITDTFGIQHTDGVDGFPGAGGVSMIDFNNDGLDDITFVGNNNYPVSVYQMSNNEAILSNIFDYGFGYSNQIKQILWVDYDNDGDKDLFALTYLGAGSQLYKNDNGLLINVTSIAGLHSLIDPSIPSHSAAWLDYDRDGFLDLFVGNRSQPGSGSSLTNLLFKNNGDGSFSDVTTILHVNDAMTVNTLSCPDINNDGWPDIFIAVDKFDEPNLLYINNQGTDFYKITSQNFNTDVDMAFDAMSAESGDYDNDGDLDIYVTNGVQGNVFLRNDGNGVMTNIANQMGLEINKFMWGANFFDYDNDGWLDLLACSQVYGVEDSIAGLYSNPLFKNNNGTSFQEIQNGIHLDTLSSSYGSAVGDINNDGYYDVSILNSDSTFSKLYLNSGGDNNWIKVSLEGVTSNRDAIGTWIKVHTNGREYVRYTTCGNGYNSQNSNNIIIGIGQNNYIDSIELVWTSGLEESYYNLSPNSNYHFIEGESTIPSDIEELSHSNIICYPNPIINNQVSIKGIPSEIISIHIKNLKGVEVDYKKYEIDENQIMLSFTDLPKGLYYIVLETKFSKTYITIFIKI